MGDSYREELKRKKTRSGHATQAMVREGTEGRTAIREQYFRKSPTGRHRSVKATQARLRGF